MFPSVPEDYKLNPGAVEAMVLHPENTNHVLIGYNRGLMVLWDMKTPTAVEVSPKISCWYKLLKVTNSKVII